MAYIYLIRHGQASFGGDDYDMLSALGTKQAQLLGQWFRSYFPNLDAGVVGTMRRHLQTAQHFFAAFDAPTGQRVQWTADPGFDEYDHDHLLSCWERATGAAAIANRATTDMHATREFQQRFALAFERWTSGQHDVDYQISWQAFRARCVAALDRLAEKLQRDQNAVVFTSGGPISALCQHVLGMPDDRVAPLQWQLVNTSVTRLHYRPRKISLASFNSTAHLELAGGGTLITYR
jgi:broad specificity phosphatase PhoE